MSEYKVKYACTCAAYDPVLQMKNAMGLIPDNAIERKAVCEKHIIGTKWVCSRKRGHSGECAGCDQHRKLDWRSRNWHGATAEFPNGRWSSWAPEP